MENAEVEMDANVNLRQIHQKSFPLLSHFWRITIQSSKKVLKMGKRIFGGYQNTKHFAVSSSSLNNFQKRSLKKVTTQKL
jgi:hypothetical protein